MIGSIAPSYSFVPHSSSSSTTTEEDNAMHWEEIKVGGTVLQMVFTVKIVLSGLQFSIFL